MLSTLDTCKLLVFVWHEAKEIMSTANNKNWRDGKMELFVAPLRRCVKIKMLPKGEKAQVFALLLFHRLLFQHFIFSRLSQSQCKAPAL